MKKWIAVLLTLVMVLGCVSALADSWYCPECGQKNDSNFCSNCGTRRPNGSGSSGGNISAPSTTANDMMMTKAVMNSDGSVSMAWSGGKSPYNVYYMWYANANHNSGADVQVWRAGSSLISQSFSTRNDFVPGERYWIVIQDANKQECWYDFNPSRKAFTALSGTHMTMSLRKKVNNRSSTVGSFSANEIERQYVSSLYGATIKMTLGRLKTTFYFTSRMALFLPSGEPYLFHVADQAVNSSAVYWESYDFKDVWDWLVSSKGGIPTGQYVFRLYVDDRVFGEEVININ